ncbi:hypothetical protein [Parasitella parasitica]|uniref:Carbohydrate-binding module family 19 domain-containing protein n=1 Tax=Parasitella parasitica TaxID=35722 RepID=A0A0B7NKF5_9FUNG|nr:hypothetical protein [Parasitella parasitica]
MHISTCVAIIALGATLVPAKPLNTDLYHGDDAVESSSIKVEWTDLISSDNEKDIGDSSYYKEFANRAALFNTADQPTHADSNKAPKTKVKMDTMDANQSLFKEDRNSEGLEEGQLTEERVSGNPSDTKYAVISKTQHIADFDSDGILSDVDTRNALTKNEFMRDTTDYVNKEIIDKDIVMPGHTDSKDIPIRTGNPIQGEEQSPIFDIYDALDQALLDPYIEGIDSDLNSEVYEEPGETTLTVPSDQPVDYRSLVAEQIRLAEEQIKIKHDELLQDQEQIENLKRKVHQSFALSTTTFTTGFSMEVVETGPNETMYVYKGIPTTATTTDVAPLITTTTTTTAANADTSMTNQQPPSVVTPLLISIQENETEYAPATSAEINTPLYKLVQKQADQDLYDEATKNPAESDDNTDLVTHMSDTATFDPLNKLELPNGSWTPSCKHVSQGFYCLHPDGKGPTIIQCSGENVGFEFSCGKNMMCYSAGPFDVDCRKNKKFY